MKYPLTNLTWSKEEYDSLISCIHKKTFTMGKKVKLFEKQFAKYFGSKYAVMVNSGSSANLISIYSLFFKRKNAIRSGDEVIVPGLSWSTTFNPLINFGLKLKFIDISIDTLNFDESLIEKAITPSTKAIFSVNLLGKSCDYSKILKIAHKHKLYLIEDNCESLGSKFNKKYNGTIGDLGTFSFFFSHQIQTMEGGMTLTDNEELYQICLSLRAHGWTREIPNNKYFKEEKDWFKAKFNFILPGFNLRPLELSGALGIEQLKRLNYFKKIRKKNAILFYKLFEHDKDFMLQKYDNESSFFSFALIKRKKSKINLKKLLLNLKYKNIEVRPIASGMFINQPISKYFHVSKKYKLENTAYVSNNSFYVGNYPKDLTQEINYLLKSINQYRKENL